MAGEGVLQGLLQAVGDAAADQAADGAALSRWRPAGVEPGHGRGHARVVRARVAVQVRGLYHCGGHVVHLFRVGAVARGGGGGSGLHAPGHSNLKVVLRAAVPRQAVGAREALVADGAREAPDVEVHYLAVGAQVVLGREDAPADVAVERAVVSLRAVGPVTALLVRRARRRAEVRERSRKASVEACRHRVGCRSGGDTCSCCCCRELATAVRSN
mmetsp:Transcript_13570/g.51807  ORF Transcript_13570/g.51807 Transcript_13570/m.51807 type:complete len:215 (+) Transcript_13570:512-1156(+)